MSENFQYVIIGIFIVLAVFGVLVFSGAIPIGEDNEPGVLETVVLWGTVRSGTISPLIEEFNKANPAFILKYEEKRADSFDKDLLEAIATGSGPDMFILSDKLAFQYSNKIVTIPFASYPLASFKNNFVGAGETFVTSKGILAFPLTVDPLMMYYNRSLLDREGIVSPPKYWDELTEVALKLTKKDETNKIIKSAVAFGHFSNVSNAKDILTALFMQTGNKIVTERNGIFVSDLRTFISNLGRSPSGALQFYTDFANPNKDIYSWNKSFSNSRDVFSREDLAFYFGFASELKSLVNKNPNQNFGVAEIPQIKDSNFKLTNSRVTGIAILSSSKKFNAAFTVAGLLASTDFASKFANATGVAPARRDLLKVKKPNDSYSSIFYDSALFARSWLDPSEKDTDNIFRNMVDKVISNSLNPRDAISDASSKLDLLFKIIL